MKSIWHPFHLWECYAAGMYNYSEGPTLEDGKEMYRRFLSDAGLFEDAALRVVSDWPISCDHFLTKDAMNKIAWMGQASMCLHSGLSRKYRGGFHLLSASEKNKANAVAWMAIKQWEHGYARKGSAICEDVGGEGLFAGHTR